jgi:hypothetical protein
VGEDPADYVLGNWSEADSQWLAGAIDTSSDAAQTVLTSGIVAAMNQFNVREKAAHTAAHGTHPNPSAPEKGALEQ